jgi:hypothetical protein
MLPEGNVECKTAAFSVVPTKAAAAQMGKYFFNFVEEIPTL